MQNILVPIDFSDATEKVVAKAAEVGLAFGSTIRLLHVAAPDPSIASSKTWPQEVRDELAKELHTEHHALEALADALTARGLSVKAMLTRGPVADTILDFADRTETGLIILGAHQHGTFSELLPRSTIKSIIRRASCPVLVVPYLRPDEVHEQDTSDSASNA